MRIYLMYVVLVCCASIIEAAADDHTKPSTEPKGAAEVNRKAAEEIVASLVNRNTPPIYREDERLPTFDPKFNWDEDNRVWHVLLELGPKVEMMFDVLGDHLDDDRYCTTAQLAAGGYENLTIGYVCRQLMQSTVEQAYRTHVRSGTKVFWAKMQYAPLADKNKIKQWNKERKGKPLYLLQIEACDWAIKTLKDELRKNPKEGALNEPRDEMPSWIEAIEGQKKRLTESQKAVISDLFEGEAYTQAQPPEKPAE